MPASFDLLGRPIPPYAVETFDSRKLKIQLDGHSTGQLLYKIVGTEDEQLARGLVENEVPLVWQDMAPHDYALDHLGGGVWAAVVNYQANKPSYTLDTTGGTLHVTQARANMANISPTGAPGTAPDFKGAVGFDGNTLAGCDITVPVWKWTETYLVPVWRVTARYLKVLFYCTGKVNAALWKGYPKGDVLFLGATGAQRGTNDVELVFHLAAQPNINGDQDPTTILQIGDVRVTNKEGWWYLWTRYDDVVDPTAKMLVKRPLSVHLERVYDYADLSLLGIDQLLAPGGA